ncbi:MAG TPA: glycosyltransferase family 2 protein [Lacipirellulaceae bacterium]|mgnify:FL=1|nr:glycosyltransferase family 2 protein [Lacipirellulaceae bacterium]
MDARLDSTLTPTSRPNSPVALEADVEARLRAVESAVDAYLELQPPAAPVHPEVAAPRALELSVVMPCLNEADTLATCINKARRTMDDHGIVGEIVVADNGSTDGSVEIAMRLGARVIHVSQRGYGHALMAGIAATRGKYVIMGDADDSYDFLEIPKFVAELRAGHELVQGCRLPSGGGRVLPGAMPPSHRWIGNPAFSWLVRRMFRAPIHDVYCGLRGFRRELFDRLDLRCTGMEFATEMIIKSTLFGVDIVETPTTLHPDGRTSHAPHLRTIRDGWRTLRFFLMYSPRWLFLAPGLLLLLAGAVGYALALPAATIGGVTFDAHTLLVASLAAVLGFQLLQFAVFAKTFAISEGLMPEGRLMAVFRRRINLEFGLVAGAVALGVGLALIGAAVNQWRLAGFGALDYARTMRWTIPGVTLAALGFQTASRSGAQ